MTRGINFHEVEEISNTFAPSNIQSSVKTTAVEIAMATQRLFSNGWNIFHHDTYTAKRAPLGRLSGCSLDYYLSCDCLFPPLQTPRADRGIL